jgi:hypothetical protein
MHGLSTILREWPIPPSFPGEGISKLPSFRELPFTSFPLALILRELQDSVRYAYRRALPHLADQQLGIFVLRYLSTNGGLIEISFGPDQALARLPGRKWLESPANAGLLASGGCR